MPLRRRGGMGAALVHETSAHSGCSVSLALSVYALLHADCLPPAVHHNNELL